MVTLIKNEFIKIFKRKNIYILLFLSMLVLLVYNLYLKSINPKEDISKLYESAYDSDMLYLEYYENFSEKEKGTTYAIPFITPILFLSLRERPLR